MRLAASAFIVEQQMHVCGLHPEMAHTESNHMSLLVVLDVGTPRIVKEKQTLGMIRSESINRLNTTSWDLGDFECWLRLMVLDDETHPKSCP